MKKRVLLTMVAILGAWACAQGERDAAAEGEEVGDTLTTQERDSVMSELPIPGISGIRDARRATDAARERAEAHDTIH